MDRAVQEPEPSGRARGGITRAQRLSPEQRSEASSRAAKARWSGEVTQAICGSPDHPLQIGDAPPIECYVLADGTRVLSQRGMLAAMGRHRKVRKIGDVEPILQGKAIEQFISDEMREKIKPITFQRPHGGRAMGYNAEMLPAICDVYLRARAAGVLPQNQEHIAERAEILVRGLATVGIIALVDEATGYQEVRAKDALARILEAFIDKELQPWVSTFPVDFYREMFRLKGLDFPTDTVRRPQYFGHYTNNIVYSRLAPGVLQELKRVQRRSDDGRPKDKLFQRLTTNKGYPQLREHLGSVVTLMKLSDTWDEFMANLDRLHPRVGETMPLELEWAGKGF